MWWWWLALTSYSCWTEREGERDREGAVKERGSTSEGNANVRPYNPGNEAFSSAGETRLRDSSTAAAGKREREGEGRVAALHVSVTLFDGRLVRKRRREETKQRMRWSWERCRRWQARGDLHPKVQRKQSTKEGGKKQDGSTFILVCERWVVCWLDSFQIPGEAGLTQDCTHIQLQAGFYSAMCKTSMPAIYSHNA